MSLQQPMNYQTSACYPCKDIFSEFYTVLQDWIRLTSNPKAHLYTDIYYNDGFFSTVKAIEFSFCIFDAFHYIYIIKFVEYLFSISRYYYFPHRLLHMRTMQVKLGEVTFPDHTTNKCQFRMQSKAIWLQSPFFQLSWYVNTMQSHSAKFKTLCVFI